LGNEQAFVLIYSLFYASCIDSIALGLDFGWATQPGVVGLRGAVQIQKSRLKILNVIRQRKSRKYGTLINIDWFMEKAKLTRLEGIFTRKRQGTQGWKELRIYPGGGWDEMPAGPE
jgi:hypothetical protein